MRIMREDIRQLRDRIAKEGGKSRQQAMGGSADLWLGKQWRDRGLTTYKMQQQQGIE